MTDAVASQIQAVGRRKTSVARVILRTGSGGWKINGRTLEDYFPRMSHRHRITEPITVAELTDEFDIIVRAHGGGISGQADAVRLGIARALLKRDPELRPTFRQLGLLTRDARKVERKKPGRPKARKRFQFSKR